MNCRAFTLAVEDYLALRSCREPVGDGMPAAVTAHAAACAACAARLQETLRGRALLGSLASASPEPAVDPFFYTRLKGRIQAEANGRRHPMRGLGILWSDLAIAALLFGTALGTFLVEIHRTEVPNADAAIALEVPRTNPFQTPERLEGRATRADVLVSLLIP